jgi:outer membrane lipoprotein carrier protein
MDQSFEMAASSGALLNSFQLRKWPSLVRSLHPWLPMFALAIFGSGPPWAADATSSFSASPDKVLELFETRYRSAKTLSAVFLEQFSENGKLVRKEAGRAYFLHPGKMRWDYEAPEKNMFLVDGKYVWFYSSADHTATRMPAKKSEDWRTPLAFLTSDMKLSRICARVEPDRKEVPSESGDLVFRCTMRTSQGGDTGVRTRDQPVRPPLREEGSVLFELSPDGELRRIVIAQEGRTQLEFSFKEWLWNPALPKSWFEFVPPIGVAIVDGLLSDESGMRQ